MPKIQDSENAIPFDDIIIALYENRNDKTIIEDIYKLIIKNKRDYSLVHLSTLTSTCLGYLQKLKLTS